MIGYFLCTFGVVTGNEFAVYYDREPCHGEDDP